MGDYKPIVKDLLAGTTGGCLGIVVSQPFDVAKVRLQTIDATSTTLQVIKSVARKDGLVGLWRGVWPPLLSNGSVNAVVFAAYGSAMRMMGKHPDDEPTVGEAMVGGMYAGLFTVQISTATEHIKCRQQVASQRVPTWEMTKRIAGEGGWVRGLNRGWVSCMIRDVPSFGVYFGVYEYSKAVMSAGQDDGATAWQILCSGAAAGVIAWGAVYPMDTLKSMIQSTVGGPNSTRTANPFKLWREEAARMGGGWKGQRVLWRGFTACCIRAMPLNAVSFLGYELTSEWLDDTFPS